MEICLSQILSKGSGETNIFLIQEFVNLPESMKAFQKLCDEGGAGPPQGILELARGAGPGRSDAQRSVFRISGEFQRRVCLALDRSV